MRGRPGPGDVNNAGSALPVSRRGPEREHVVAALGGLLTIAARWRHSRRTLVETTVLADERGQLSADATGPGDPAPGHRPGDAGSAHRPACLGGQTPPPGRLRRRQRG